MRYLRPTLAVAWLVLVVGCSAPQAVSKPATTAPAQNQTPARAQVQATPTPASPAHSPTPAPVLMAAPSATPGVHPQSVWVADTDGQGVYVRQTPDMADKLRAYPEGTELFVTGPQVEQNGQRWQSVRAPDGTEGFVPAEYVVVQRPPAIAANRTAPTARPAPQPPMAVATTAPVQAPSMLPQSAYTCNPPGVGCGEVSATTGRVRDQYVSGYYRRDGTYVRPYYRSHR